MQILSLAYGGTLANVSPNNATLTVVTLITGGANVRGVAIYSGQASCEDLPDSEASVYTVNGSYYLRVLRGGVDRLNSAIFIPSGNDVTYATCRNSNIRLSYTIF